MTYPADIRTGMDDTFSFQTTERQRRLDPRAFRLAVLAGVIVLAVGAFANWVVSSERASFARVRASDRIVQPQPAPVQPVAAAGPTADDAARLHAEVALAAAERVVEWGTFADASPARLTGDHLGFTFVEGPSTESEVISVAVSRTGWAAAVMSGSGTCYYIHLAKGDAVTFGTGSNCTGSAALSAVDASW
jgi:hypothetical protein